jgi:hypothetical protein
VTPNSDRLVKADHEIDDVLWVSYSDIISDRIPGKTVSIATPLAKKIVKRIVRSEQFMERGREGTLPGGTDAILLSKKIEQKKFLYPRGDKVSKITLHNIVKFEE